ncbi:DUF6215 domain-containing protein [Streptomyces sp. NBC_00047]|uniref:DUF6215 domain-containing protein n=1 Tax=Streptomyces sp. NBC_00047 TaxID=2975627 RepID=UPI0022582A90|nr:DUF6215 domain-containing protein [Streptomyces sp. NBC_00047]MCX5611797.1 DUF6215 domain-containing protein [Streptomyces sp. NBC_00047]
MRVRENSRRDDDRPAACSSQDQDLPAGYVSGVQLCTALNRPDLPVLFGTSASYDRLPVAETADLLGFTAQKTTVLGRPAVLYSDRTIGIILNFNGGKTSTGTGPGGIARSLVVAKDAQDGGGSFEVVIWRQDGRLPDDTALFRTAEQVLPTSPGWTAG